MELFETIKETLHSGDPYVRTWFMVESNCLPFISSFLYVLFVKKLGPSIMKNRKPFDLRTLMIVYNFSIVFAYTVSLILLISIAFYADAMQKICEPTIIRRGDYTYWIFFVLRKKYHLITNLHVIHHAALPVIGWVFIRTERSGFQFFPAGINSFVHIVMYTYYGLAAMGPEVQKQLWWKEHLTKLQMVQFVVIIVFVIVIVPLSGCKTTQHGIYIEITAAAIFLALFYNFYIKTYKKPLKMGGKVEDTKKNVITNGKCKSNEYDCDHASRSEKEFSSVHETEGELRRR
ncbi:elongation of very long chain fatty acids protein 7 [Trichonephila inaurata madagascariensis]|uniref:Elongation of very long chain fatty acids protein n=1 Tax=Trichonephila inaurata madagascariensis TaxID=2747483 RepID=A0A8X6Y7D8_9ARAC|nr:elongation of very long chain fatty acids protein 7 [Trichonephila inaurata madagascariensis]